MKVVCLDLEGVLIPEVWQAVAGATGIQALGKTTRDVPVYADLMNMRLAALRDSDVSYSQVLALVDELQPLTGAKSFLDALRREYQVVIVSDTFYEFGMPFMAKLGQPTLLCHRLEVADDRIVGYRLRQEDPKRHSVKAFQALRYPVIAAGDSYNDIPMLQQAQAGILFMAPDNVKAEYPDFAQAETYAELSARIEQAASAL